MPDFVEYPQVSYYLCLFESGFKECYKHGLEFDRPGEMPAIENQIQIIKDAIASIEDGPDAERQHEYLNNQLDWLKFLNVKQSQEKQFQNVQSQDKQSQEKQFQNVQSQDKQSQEKQFQNVQSQDKQSQEKQFQDEHSQGEQSQEKQFQEEHFQGEHFQGEQSCNKWTLEFSDYEELVDKILNELPELSDSNIEELWNELNREMNVRELFSV